MAENDEVTAATPEVEATESADTETPANGESTQQESATKLEAFERRLREIEEVAKRETEARAEAERRAAAADEARATAERERDLKISEYRGLQSSTTRKMQELSLLQQQLANQELVQGELQYMRKLIDKLAERDLDPEEAAKLRDDLKNEQVRQENEKLRARIAQQEQAAQRANARLTPQQKIDYKAGYFAKYADVNPLDLSDAEWHLNDARNAEEWLEMVRQEFERRQVAIDRAKASTKPAAAAVSQDDIAEQIRVQTEKQIAAIRQEDAKRFQEATAEVEALKAELAETKRLAEEAKNRRRGMDRTGSTTSAGPSKAGKVLAEIPDEWLYGTPEQKKAYRAAMDNKSLRAQILKGNT